jgi:hypothetical protein
MYNAIAQDETEVRNLFFSIPILLTFLLAFLPFALNNFIDARAKVAVDNRLKQTEDIIREAQSTVKGLTTEIKNALENATKSSESGLHNLRAFIDSRVAYLHWNQGDADIAAYYAKRASHDAVLAIQILGSDSAAEKIREFEKDTLDTRAYYVAELFCTAGKLDEDAESAKERCIYMLEQVEAADIKSESQSNLIERVDSCLFVIWAFRNHLQNNALVRATALFQNWQIALENHDWKRGQKENYCKYKTYYEDRLSSAVPAS